MKVVLIARKVWLELVREPQMLLLLLGFPLFMMTLTGFGYATVLKLHTYPILAACDGAEACRLREALVGAVYQDGRPVFDVLPLEAEIGSEALELALKEQKAALAVSFSTNLEGHLAVTVRGDATSLDFTRASTLMDELLKPLLERDLGKPELIRMVERPLTAASPRTEFDAYAPGMMIMAVLFLIPPTAMLLGRERRWGTLERLRMSKLTSAGLLSGVSLAMLAAAVIEVLIMFGAVLAFGFNNRGSLALAIGIGVLLSFSAIGFGLIVACFAQNDSEAANIGAVFTMVQVFLSGSFFAMPELPILQIGGRVVGLFDLLPATHALVALQQVLVRGAGPEQVAFRVAAMGVLSVLCFGIGIWMFQRRQYS